MDKLAPLPPIPRQPDLRENKKQRIILDIMLRRDPSFAERVKERCKRDFKFWANYFCFAYDDHRPADQRKIPLCMFEFQEEMALGLVAGIWRCIKNPIERWNAGADKARRMTATFTALLVVQWFAQFHGISTTVTSKTEEDVDIQGNMDSPFERLRWQIEQQLKQYPFLFPADFDFENKQHNKKKFLDFQNGGQIKGCAPTGKALRQGRSMIYLGDEFAFVEKDRECWEAAAGTAKVRLVFSTPNGPFCKFYRLVFKLGDTAGEKGEDFHLFELDWFKHPDYAKGLYRKPDGSLSSPYMDNIIKNNTRQVVAREYMRDHNESIGGLVFKYIMRPSSKRLDLTPDPEVRTIYRIQDPGLWFAFLWMQKDRYGRALFLHELTKNVEEIPKGTTLLDWICKRAIQDSDELFDGWNIVDLGDPYASRQQLASQEKTEYELEKENHGMRVQSAYMYKISAHEREKRRIELLSNLMQTDVELPDGNVTPKLLISADRCPLLLEAFESKFRREVDPDTGETTDTIIEARPYVDLVDCAGMGAIKLFDTRKRDENKPPPRPGAGRNLKWKKAASAINRRRYA